MQLATRHRLGTVLEFPPQHNKACVLRAQKKTALLISTPPIRVRFKNLVSNLDG